MTMEEIIYDTLTKLGINGAMLWVAYKILKHHMQNYITRLENRMGEFEDKQDATVDGLKASSALNGQFTTAYDKALNENRTSREKLNKNIKKFE